MKTVGLIGCGFMGGMHAQVLKQLEGVELAAAASHAPEAGRAKLRNIGWDVPVYPDIGTLLARHEVEVIDICAPTDLHAEVAETAARAGKHLFCEKPLALSLEGAGRIEAAVEAAGVHAQVGHCIRFWPEYRALKAFADSGRGGKLLSLALVRRASRPGYSEQNWLNRPERSGGAAVDLHIHDTDFVHYLLGTPAAVTSRISGGACGPDHISTLYHFGGCAVSAEGGWDYPPQWGFQMAFDAVFENASISYDSRRSPTLQIVSGDETARALPFEAPGSGASSTGEGNISSLGGYYNELHSFFSRLEANCPPETATVAQASRSLQTVLAELESARAGRTVNLD
jgi:predicted dehydrogenase